MGKANLKIIRALPGPTTVGPILEAFERKGEGIVTSLNDTFLPAARRLLSEGGSAEVKPFGEVVRIFHLKTGRETRRVASGGQQLAAVAEACTQLPTDSPFEAVANFSGFHRAVLSTLKELHSYGIWLSKFEEIAEQCADPALKAKLISLGEIDRRLLEILTLVGTTTLTQLFLGCEDEILDEDGQHSRLLVFAHSQVSPQAFKWLRWLADQGCEVTVVVDRHSRNGRVFEAVPKILSLLDGKVSEIGVGNRILESLFCDEAPQGPLPRRGVRTQCAADPLAECEWALRYIHEVLNNADNEGEQVAILARNSEVYCPLVDVVARRFGIEVAIRRRVPLLSNGFARFCLSILEGIADPDIRPIGRVLAHKYMSLSEEVKKELALMTEVAHRAENSWITLAESLKTLETEDGQSAYQVANWRLEQFEARRSPSDWYREFRAFVDGSRWFQKAADGTGSMIDRDQRAYTAMCGSLAQTAAVATVVGPDAISLGEFIRMARRVWEEADVSLPSPDAKIVMIQSPEEIDGADLVVVLGLLEGVFPRRRSEDAILSDFEREAISDLNAGQIALQNSFDQARAERDVFYRVCALAKNELVLSYPLTDSERDNVRAFYLQEIERITEIESEVRYPRNQLVPSVEARHLEADVRFAEALQADREAPMPNDLRTDQAMDLIRGSAETFTPASLRRVTECPFKYFAKDVLKLRPKQKLDRYSLLNSVPVKASLARTLSRADARDQLTAEISRIVDEIQFDVAAWELQLIKSVSERMVDEWLDREFEARMHWDRNPSLTKQNVAFGSEYLAGSKLGINLEGHVPAITDDGNYRTLHLFRESAPERPSKTDADMEKDLLKYGILFAAMFAPGKTLRIEVDGMNGKRALIYFGLPEDDPATRKPTSDLYVVDILDPYGLDGREAFISKLRGIVKKAVTTVQTGDIRPKPGSHCAYCEFGDLCRRAQDFSEVADPLDLLLRDLQEGGE